jgi:hypothetical protein
VIIMSHVFIYFTVHIAEYSSSINLTLRIRPSPLQLLRKL